MCQYVYLTKRKWAHTDNVYFSYCTTVCVSETSYISGIPLVTSTSLAFFGLSVVILSEEGTHSKEAAVLIRQVVAIIRRGGNKETPNEPLP